MYNTIFKTFNFLLWLKKVKCDECFRTLAPLCLHTVFSMIDHLLLFLHSFFQAEKKLSFIKSFWRQLCIRLENLWSRTLQWFSDKFFAKQILRLLSSLYALWCKYLDKIRQKWNVVFWVKTVTLQEKTYLFIQIKTRSNKVHRCRSLSPLS